MPQCILHHGSTESNLLMGRLDLRGEPTTVSQFVCAILDTERLLTILQQSMYMFPTRPNGLTQTG